MKQDSRISYVELCAEEFSKVEAFYGDVFGWTFQDYGDCFCAFNDGSMDGGFYRSPLHSDSGQGAALVVLYAKDLEATQERITAAGGRTLQAYIFLPRRARFHFLDPNRNELAVWSDR